ncbi:MAG: hypothetical protein ACR2OF_01820 [Hyphomicrobium sp.]
MGNLSVNQQGTTMKQLAYLLLVAAYALAPLAATMAGGGGGGVIQEEDGYQPILPDVGGGDDGGYRPEWADPNPRPSDLGVNEDPTPFDPSDPVGIPPNQD